MKQFINIILAVVVATVGLFATNANDLIKKELLGSSYSGGVTTLDWVIRFDSNNSTLQDEPIEIIDVFNGVQTYLPPTEAHPNGWSVTQDPSGFTWQSESISFYTHSFPNASLETKTPGSGDGFAPIPYTALNGDQRFYYINHHLPDTFPVFGCVGACGGTSWPKKLPDGDTSSSVTTGTSSRPYTVIMNRKLYYAVTRPTNSGIGCYDLENNSECGYAQLSNLGRSNGGESTSIEGVTRVGNALYAMDGNGVIYKVSIAGNGSMTPSGSYDATVNGMTTTRVVDNSGNSFGYGISSQVLGNKIYFTKGDNSAANRRLFCFDTTTMGQCSGWSSAKTVNTLERWGVNSFVHYDNGMSADAICIGQSVTYGGQQCFDLSSGSLLSKPPLFPSGAIEYAYGFETTVGTKTFFPSGSEDEVYCYDWANGSSCSFSPIIKSSTKVYGTALDHQGCMWVLGHNNELWSIETGNGTTPCAANSFEIEDTYDASRNWCASEHIDWHYTQFQIEGIVPGAFNDLNVTFYNSNGAVIATQTIATNTTTYTFDLSGAPFVTGEPIHYKIEGQWSASADPSQAPPHITIGVDGPPREFCFKTQVPCPVTGDIVNNAYLKYQDTAQFIDTDEVMTQGDMVCHEEIPSSGQCLSAESILQCTPVGWTVELGSFTPAGYNASNTQMQVLAPSGATVTKWGNTWYLNGVNPGDTVQLSMQGVQSGAGSLEGDDLCCDGESNITIPQDQSCEVEQPHMYVRKVYDEVSHLFSIRVVMMSTHYAPQVVSVTDTIPAGVTITGIDPSSASEWSCGNNFPVTGPASLNCVYIGSMPVSGNKYLKLTSTIDNSQMPAENCVDGGVLGTDGAPLDTVGATHFCVPVPHQDNNDTNTSDQNDTGCANGSPCPQGQMCHDGLCVDQPSLPSCSAPMILASKQFVDCNANHTSCTFTLTLTNTDAVNPYSGNVFVHDETSQPGVGTVPVQITNISPAGLCPTTPTTAPFMCVTPMSFAPGETKTYTITINPYGAGGFVPGSFDTQSENCFGAFPAPNISSGNYTNDGFDNAMFEAGYNPEGNPPPCSEFLNGNCVRYTDSSDTNNSNDQNSTDGTLCDDGSAFTINDTMTNGVCVGDLIGCQEDAECPPNGTCINGSCTPMPDGSACDDGNASTFNDTIVGGLCIGEQMCHTDAECGQNQVCINGSCVTSNTLQLPQHPAETQKPKPSAKPNLSLRKYAPKICKAGERCTFRLKITNRGKKRYSGPLSIKERPREFVGRLIGTSPKSWRCRTKRKGYICSNPKVTLDPGESTTVRLSVRIPQRAKGYLHNCAKLDPLKSGRSRIMVIQTVLKAKGFDPNGIDGGMGKGTKRALNAYMKSRNLSGKRGRAKAMQELYKSFPHAVSKNSCVKVKIKRAKCREDERLVGDICKPRCKKGQHWTGKQCVVCPRGSQWKSKRKVCVKTSRYEITVKPHGKQCTKGYVYYNGKCMKRENKKDKKCSFMQERDPHTGECRSKVDIGTVINVIGVIQTLRGGSGGGSGGGKVDVPVHP